MVIYVELQIPFTTVARVAIRRHFPTFDIATKQFVYAIDPTVAPELCVFDNNSNRGVDRFKHLSQWRTYVDQRKGRVTSVLQRVVDIKQEILSTLTVNGQFQYRTGRLQAMAKPLPTTVLEGYRSNLANIAAEKVHSQASFALVSLELDNYLRHIAELLNQVLRECQCFPATTLIKHVDSRATEAAVAAIRLSLGQDENIDILEAAALRSIQLSPWLYDSSLKRLSVVTTYYLPRPDDLVQLVSVIVLPIRSQNHELMLDVPTDHIACNRTSQVCQFVRTDMVHDQCQSLPSIATAFACPTLRLTTTDECATHVMTMQHTLALDNCGVRRFHPIPELHSLNVDDYNFLAIASLTHHASLEEICGDDVTVHDIVETMLIGTSCALHYGLTSLQSPNVSINGFSMLAISARFSQDYQAVALQVIELTTGPNVTEVILPTITPTTWQQISRSPYFMYVALPLSGVLLFLLICCSITCFALSHRRKRMRRRHLRHQHTLPDVSAMHVDPATIPLTHFTQPPRLQPKPIYTI